ncbi:MAG: nucleotidyltransferase domain-containing protein [Treponema sp.]|nr:nucleotidyltransferase domain-containing protein [Treponema sp.]
MNSSVKKLTCFLVAFMGLFILFAQESKSNAEMSDSVIEEPVSVEEEPVSDFEESDSVIEEPVSLEEESESSEDVSDSIDEFTGLSYAAEKKAVAERSNVRVRVRGDNGTFAIYSLNSKGKELSLLSSHASYSGSYFMLKIGRKIYKLNSTGGVASEARKTEQGVQLAYNVPGKACFVLDFSFPKADASENLQNVVRVRMYTANIGETPQSFSVKGVFDTVLGEFSGRHFSTAVTETVNRQKQFHTMKDELWVRSASSDSAIQFMLYGSGISDPAEVSVTSKDLLTKYWIPEVVESRGFGTPSSYNDSGIGINWKTAYLKPGEVDLKVFYLSVAEGLAPIYAGKEPAGMELLSALERKESVFESLPDIPEEYPVEQEIAENKDGKDAGVPEELSPEALAVTEEQLDPEYIQNLLDYIESIKSEDDIESDEFVSLNEELDAIFERLQSMEKKE